MKSSIYTLLLFYVFVVSCSEQQYFVKGKSTQSTLDGEYAYMAPMTNYSIPYIDSCRVVHGQFEMTGPLDSIQCVTIYMGSTGIPMVLETGEVSINFQNSNIRVSGTPLNDRFYRFLTTRDSLLLIQKELHERISEVDVYKINNNYFDDANAIQQVTCELDSLECSFVEENYDNVLGVSWFLRMCDEASSMAGYYCMPPNLEKIYKTAPPVFKHNHEIQNYLEMCKGSLYNRGYYNY